MKPAPAARRAFEAPARPEHRLVVTARWRGHGRLEHPRLDPLPADPSVAELVALAGQVGGAAVLWLTGGEPTLRADLPALIAALSAAGASIGVCSDGLALGERRAVEPLVRAGLGRVRLGLQAARAEAHDWLAGRKGAARRVRKAVVVCQRAGLEVQIAATVTRATVCFLGELVDVAAAMDVEVVSLSLPVAAALDADDEVALLPRLGPLGAEVVRAKDAARRGGLRLQLLGFPRCVAPQLDDSYFAADPVCLRLPAGACFEPLAVGRRGALVDAPPPCPGSPRCPGPPLGYQARFGEAEVDCRALVGSVAAAAGAPAAALRLRFAAPLAMACQACGDTPVVGRPEPTRTIRQRLVRAAGQGARALRIASAGSLHHPALSELLAEIGRLPFERVELCGDGSALAQWPDRALAVFARVDRLDLALYGSDAARHDAHTGRSGSFAATLKAAGRLTVAVGRQVAVYAVLHDGNALAGFAEAWSDGRLPGPPAFRLSPAGGSLDELAAAARALEPGDTRAAVAQWLPPCLLDETSVTDSAGDPGVAFHRAPDRSAPSAGSDRLGQLRPCTCGGALASRCRGVPAGWRLGSGD